MKLSPKSYITSTSEGFIEIVEIFLNTPKEYQRENTKRLNDKVRKDLNIEEVIGIGLLVNKEDESKKEVVISIYDIKATDDNFYDQELDENNIPYIEISNKLLTI